MPRISFTPHLERHVACPAAEVPGQNVRDALEAYFALHPRVRAYLLDEQAGLRRHVVVFVDDEQVRDRRTLSELSGASSELVACGSTHLVNNGLVVGLNAGDSLDLCGPHDPQQLAIASNVCRGIYLPIYALTFGRSQ